MTRLEITHSSADLSQAARQDALRWQAFAWRLPLFLLTAAGLYLLGGGLLRNVDGQVLLLQILILLGYTVVYWGGFILLRLFYGWMRARAARRARFRDQPTATLTLEYIENTVSFTEGDWHLSLPKARIYGTYASSDFLFIDSPFIPWLPIKNDGDVSQFFANLKQT